MLDTHVWIWWLGEPERLPKRAMQKITESVASDSIYISSISTWEVATLVARRRLEFTMSVTDWIALSIRILPIAL